MQGLAAEVAQFEIAHEPHQRIGALRGEITQQAGTQHGQPSRMGARHQWGAVQKGAAPGDGGIAVALGNVVDPGEHRFPRL